MDSCDEEEDEDEGVLRKECVPFAFSVHPFSYPIAIAISYSPTPLPTEWSVRFDSEIPPFSKNSIRVCDVLLLVF